MKEYRFKLANGDEERVIVAGDVVALPYRNWSGGGYAVAVSVEWMIHSGKLPKVPAELRRELAQVVVRALELRQRERHAAHGDALAELEVSRSLHELERAARQAEAELGRNRPIGLRTPTGLYDHRTGERLRAATDRELELSEQAAAEDGGRGVFEVDGRAVFAV